MVWHAKIVTAGLMVALLDGCGSTGVVPKAFETEVLTTAPVGLSMEWEGDADSPVVIAPEVIQGWQFLYRFITETEFVLCLEGTTLPDRIVIENFRLARMEASSVNSVRYQPCAGPRYVGTAHNHPPVDEAGRSLCYQSEPDRRSFGMDDRAIVDIVLCGSDKFRWWLKDGRTAGRSAELTASH